MEYKELYPFILLLIAVGMLIGIGVLTLDKFGTASYTTATYNESLGDTDIANNTPIQLTNTHLIAVSSVKNATQGTVSTSCYTTDDVDGLFYFLNVSTDCVYTPANLSVVYTYKSFGVYRTSVNAARDEVSGIATNWLGLIVTVSILSIVLFLVIRSFGNAGGR